MRPTTPTRVKVTLSRMGYRDGATRRKPAPSSSGSHLVSFCASATRPPVHASCFRPVFWLLSLGLLIRDWRDGVHHAPLDPPFNHPPTNHPDVEEDDGAGDEESTYHQVPGGRNATTDNSNVRNSPFADTNRYNGPISAPASRPSMDAYGAFSDPAPSGFGSSPASNVPPVIPEIDFGPRVSRTMQYADPYAVVRAQIAAGNPPSPTGGPPSYESYQDYR
jgi:hypothetical protein